MSVLERNDIQGLLVSAYGHLPFAAYVLLRIDDVLRARVWLGSLAADVTLATGKHHKHGLNVAIAYSGLAKLGLGVNALAWPPAFVEGMASDRRANILGDTGPSAPKYWDWGSATAVVDVMLMLFAHTAAVLEDALAMHRAAFPAGGIAEIRTLEAQRFADGKEHFGFADGIAQPAIQGEHESEPSRHRTNADNDVAPGEFVIGYRNEYGPQVQSVTLARDADPAAILSRAADGAPDFARNGSYLVLRQLEQDVAKFWQFIDVATGGPHGTGVLTREMLAAKIVGRWRSGAPLVSAPNEDDLQRASENDFNFAGDREGFRCPIGAHIRRANPRDGFAGDRPRDSVRRSNRHRILRRGRSYGPRLSNVLETDNESRGIHFICFTSDIERQFEFVQQTWLNNVTFSGLSNEVDPLVGAQPRNGTLTIQRNPVRTRVTGLERFVTTRGGAYFFLPSLLALRFLAASER